MLIFDVVVALLLLLSRVLIKLWMEFNCSGRRSNSAKIKHVIINRTKCLKLKGMEWNRKWIAHICACIVLLCSAACVCNWRHRWWLLPHTVQLHTTQTYPHSISTNYVGASMFIFIHASTHTSFINGKKHGDLNTETWAINSHTCFCLKIIPTNNVTNCQ